MTTTLTKRLAVFDSDSHVVEPPEVWEKYLDRDFRVLGKRALWRHEGTTNSYLKIDGEVVRDTMNPNLPRHAIWRPGMTWDDIGALDATRRHPMNEGAWNPRVRLADMDAMGIDQAFLYPTWFAEGFHLIADPDTAAALARAYNDWIADFCQVAPRRLFAAAMLPLQDMDQTLVELQRIAASPCFRGAFIRPMFLEDHYFTSPYYDPLWVELERLGLVAAVHPTPGLWNPEWTSHGPFFEKIPRTVSVRLRCRPAVAARSPAAPPACRVLRSSPRSTSSGDPLAPILSNWLDNHMFVASVLIGFTVMQRFPGMKVVIAHGKASWMEEVLEKMEASIARHPASAQIPCAHRYR